MKSLTTDAYRKYQACTAHD